jgi:uncharacterized membrane protein YfcA
MPETITLFGLQVTLDMQLLFLFTIVFLAGIFRGYSGFGSALFTVPALSILYGPAQAVVIAVLLETPVSLGLLPFAIREAERRTVWPMLCMFVVFVPMGAMLLRAVDPQFMEIGIPLVVLVMVGVVAMQDRLTVFLSRGGTLITGGIAGITQGMTGAAGPLFVTALLARGESASLTRANIIAMGIGIITISTISFWAVDLLSIEAIIYAALATPAILLGVWTGSALFRRMSHWNLRGIILIFLTVNAVVALFRTMV